MVYHATYQNPSKTPQSLDEKTSRVGLKNLWIGSNLEFEIQFYILRYLPKKCKTIKRLEFIIIIKSVTLLSYLSGLDLPTPHFLKINRAIKFDEITT